MRMINYFFLRYRRSVYYQPPLPEPLGPHASSGAIPVPDFFDLKLIELNRAQEVMPRRMTN